MVSHDESEDDESEEQIDEKALKALKQKNQVSVIGFWKNDDSQQEYRCYRYFYVPNLCVRQYARSERQTSKRDYESSMRFEQGIFKGQDDELFIIFTENEKFDIKDYKYHPEDRTNGSYQWKVGIINPTKEECDPKPFWKHHFSEGNELRSLFTLDVETDKDILMSMFTDFQSVEP